MLQRKTKSAGHLLAAPGAAAMGAANKGAATATTAAAKKRRPLEKRTLALIDDNTRLGTQPWHIGADPDPAADPDPTSDPTPFFSDF